MTSQTSLFDPRSWKLFLDQLLSQTDLFGLSHSLIDHVAYRVPTNERYHEVLAELNAKGELLGEIRGRRLIAVVRLAVPLNCHGVAFSLIELMGPKPDVEVDEGWDHAEFLVLKSTLESFMKEFPDVTFDTRSLAKKLNPTVAVKLEHGLTVKFHRVPLDEIIRLEQALDIAPLT